MEAGATSLATRKPHFGRSGRPRPERDPAYEASVNQTLQGYLSNANDRDTEAIGRHLGEIESALGKILSGSVDLRFGGSVAKHTYVDGLSDVDALVLLDSCELADKPPPEARARFAQRLRERFPSTDVREGRLAVTIAFTDAEIQILPAVSCGDRVRVANSEGDDWSEVNPKAFARALQAANAAHAAKLVPTIKLAKALISEFPEQQRLSGYHVEALAIRAFEGYSGPHDLKSLLRRFFHSAAEVVLSPVEDVTSQSHHVDEYLGAAASLERRIVSDALARTARRIDNADARKSLSDWRSLFGD